MKPLAEMTEAARAARIAELDAARPAAIEPDIVQTFNPGVICFMDGQYRAVSPDVAIMWPHIGYLIEGLLGMLPARHRLDYWRQRIDSGATLALAFADSEQNIIRDAGILNCELDDEGKPVVAVLVCTFRKLNLDHVARIAEAVALKHGAAAVNLWTPYPVPVVAGYQVENCACGFLQTVAIEPIQ